MGRMSRQKGKRGEREAAAELAVVFGCEARRGVQYQGGPDSPDVVLEGVAVHVEVKRTETLSLYTATDQARHDAGGKVPLVLHRRNGKAWVAIVELEHLPSLAAEVVRARSLQNATATMTVAKCYTPPGG
jgi:Holliday junction resolvase